MATLLERARAEGTPLVDGETVTFLWQGAEPALLIGDFNDWDTERAPELAQEEPGVWTASLAVPVDAYLEYAWVTDRRDDGGSDRYRAPDPFNERRTPNGLGATNQFFLMPEAPTSPLLRRRRGVARGALTRHLVPTGRLAAGATRRVALYRPAVSGPHPLLVVLDGNDYLRYARITAIVDNLVDQGRIQPVGLALVWNHGSARFAEYACSEATTQFLLGVVLPLAADHLDLDVRPGAHGALGASMGGVMALFLGLTCPDVFGRVYSQAGAFSLGDRDLVVYDLVRSREPVDIDIRIDNGSYDFLSDTNTRMYRELAERGYRVSYRESRAGHNYRTWAAALGDGLEALFPPR